ncbi:helix-turn-helix domain-containing protein [Dinghuibacter silviterrae]|uniref:AraC-like DNA-binding protein n=1 Tax=Dinghuibacter silviterrae TaxID=1539049 RepID=A0A4R8DGL6_9BACT|nr:helix-turn-helix domain-containing protein [Dinghuibacter silviterrae]TDW96256.1 AraC-like DNA-binding protein [Dinghuibacter silviterrae]
MQTRERVDRFLERWGKAQDKASGFHVYRLDDTPVSDRSPLMRRDYYKISLLLEGAAVIAFADRTIPIKGAALIFSNPMIPYAWQRVSEKQTGYFCLFTEAFLNNQVRNESPAGSSFFRAQGDHVLFPDPLAAERIAAVFGMMLQEVEGVYAYKYDVLRSHVQLLIHEAHKMTPPVDAYTPTTSADRITEVFLTLLARQFPIASTHDRIRIKTAAGFAEQLSVHVNHLNKSVKAVTGKTTTEWIVEHIVKEAKALLQHTTWDVAEIGYCLGFAHATNFSIFFKKMVGETPHHFRQK